VKSKSKFDLNINCIKFRDGLEFNGIIIFFPDLHYKTERKTHL